MRLAAIYNVWADWKMLEHSIRNIRPLVDGIVIVGSERSNHGEYFEIPYPWRDDVMLYQWLADDDLCLCVFDPNISKQPRENETDKRNYGLQIARDRGYTHFLMMDADEFYEPEPFLKEKEKFLNPDLMGLVCRCQVYFKSPKLTIGIEQTLVPFIHKITPTIRHEFNKRYPFAWIDGQLRIDPTRSLNINSGVEWTDLVMHHYSWVRPDFELKIRNSTARRNLERSTILNDLVLAKEGYFVEFYQRHLQRSSVDFGIPEFQ